MRDYGRVSPRFWIGETGKALRGKPDAQLLALYLMTSPHATMIGLYHCPIVYMAHETGMTIEGASKALQSLIEADFCTFDDANEYVFVHQFALHQIGDELSENDKRCKGVENELAKVPKGQCWQAFVLRYGDIFHIKDVAHGSKNDKPHRRAFEAPSKPGAGAGAGAVIKEAKASSSTSNESKLDACPHEAIVELFGKHLPTLPQPRLELWRDGKNAKALASRWRWVLTAKKQSGERYAQSAEQALAWFERYFIFVSESDFLMGRKGEFVCTLGWLVNASNFEKVLSSNYVNKVGE